MATYKTITVAGVLAGAIAWHSTILEAQQVTAAVRVSPSVVWCDDFSTLRFEVTIRNRTDVARVEIPDLDTGGVLVDDGTNGDAVAGDNVFTGFGGDVFCGSTGLDGSADGVTARTILGGLLLKNGSRVPDVVSAFIGEVSRSLRGAFPVTDLGEGSFSRGTRCSFRTRVERCSPAIRSPMSLTLTETSQRLESCTASCLTSSTS